MFINRISKRNHRGNDYRQFEIHTIQSFLLETTDGEVHSIFEEAYSMIWIEKGSGDITIDLAKFKIEENSIYYIKPGQVLELELGNYSNGYIICFDREFFELYEKRTSELINTPLFNNYLNVPVIKIDNSIDSFMRNIATEMLQEFKNHFDLRVEILKGLLKIFIIYLSRQFDNERKTNFYSRKMELANSFFMLLEKNFIIKKQVKEYAEMLAVTPNYLNDIIKEISGFTAGYHIQRKIILEAKRKVIFEGYSLKEIAYNLGFFDPSHFSKYFKNSSGINFTDFKKGVSNFF
ncbi:helix-turn-helix domain-containing protein [Ferruginibacter paludis]|uniref:helix-turn-helix domain-containing protein n=1 Tax=Ferruginibacter paludis TaxID=1310417 RepID=UPI0025B29144|nr:helix-turn-helix domain-containing protein [Ferruginibacter paludis]MDN3656104.1 helix-turn-helix domain-containing protein [Ferruginibacter paludis]